MFTSTFPYDKGGYSPLPSKKITVAQVLKENGYYTAGFHSNPLISHYFNYHRGFTKYFDSMKTETNNPVIGPVMNRILGFFEQSGERSNAALNHLQNLPFPKALQTSIKKLFYSVFLGRKTQYYEPAARITRRARSNVQSRKCCVPFCAAVPPSRNTVSRTVAFCAFMP